VSDRLHAILFELRRDISRSHQFVVRGAAPPVKRIGGKEVLVRPDAGRAYAWHRRSPADCGPGSGLGGKRKGQAGERDKAETGDSSHRCEQSIPKTGSWPGTPYLTRLLRQRWDSTTAKPIGLGQSAVPTSREQPLAAEWEKNPASLLRLHVLI